MRDFSGHNSAFCQPELLAATRAGNKAATLALYNANRGLIYRMAARYAHIDNAVDLEDLMQSAFFAVIEAAKQYDPARGSWAQSLKWAIQREYRIIFGKRKEVSEITADAPIFEGATETLKDAVPGNETADGDVLQEDFRQSVRNAVRRYLDDETADMIEKCDLGGMHLRDYCKACSRSYGQTTAKRRIALRKLARRKEVKQLYTDALEIQSRCYYRQPAENVAILLLSRKGR